MPNGDRLWTLNLLLPGALSTHVLYDEFWIPEGGKFFVYNRETRQSIGAVTSEFLNGSVERPQEFATALIYGEHVTLEYYQPAWVKEKAVMSISRIDCGYRFVNNPYQTGTGEINASGACQVNINCPEGNNWQNEKHALARILAVFPTDSYWDSGFLINNTGNNRTPYFMTANHCLNPGGEVPYDAISNPSASQWMFYWEYEYSGCTNSGTPPTRVTTGATVVANHSATDFALLQLTQSPIDLNGVVPYFLGWDRTTSPSAGGVGIHHPVGDVKKISTHNITPANSDCRTINYWKINWMQTANGFSVTEGGSSGSPLLRVY